MQDLEYLATNKPSIQGKTSPPLANSPENLSAFYLVGKSVLTAEKQKK